MKNKVKEALAALDQQSGKILEHCKPGAPIARPKAALRAIVKHEKLGKRSQVLQPAVS